MSQPTTEELISLRNHYQEIIEDYYENGTSDAVKIKDAWEKLKTIKQAIESRASEVIEKLK